MKGGARRIKPQADRIRDNSRRRPYQRPQVQAEPVETLATPPGLTAAERAYWDYYMPLLASLRVLSSGDRDVLVNHCIGLAQVADIRQQQQSPEYRRLVVSVTVDGAGQERVKAMTNPLDVQLRAWLQLTRLSAAELGLSPASRSRAAVAGPVQETNELEDFIQTPLRRVK
jgi:phage terminase small subunit